MDRAIVNMEYVACNLCGADDPVIVYRKRGNTIDIVYDIVKCKNCCLVYVNPRLIPKYAKELYSNDYYEGKGFDPHAFMGSNKEREESSHLIVKCLKNALLKDKENPRLLDVGGGEGLISYFALKTGFEVLMCDNSKAAIERAKRRGIPCFHGEITEEFFDEHLGSYDAIIALEVLEHLYDPMTFLKRVYQLLKPGGVFFYSTGNFQRTRFQRGRWGYLSVPEGHLYFFTPRTIKLFFEKAGFKQFLDPYKFYFNNNIVVKVLSKCGIAKVNSDFQPKSFIEKILYCYLYKKTASILGRAELPFPVK